MADYISRDDVLRKLIEGDGNDDFTEGYNFAVNEHREKIKAIPAADVQSVEHGRWICNAEYCKRKGYKPSGVGNYYWCSECDGAEQKPSDFCPNCGADMRGEQND